MSCIHATPTSFPSFLMILAPGSFSLLSGLIFLWFQNTHQWSIPPQPPGSLTFSPWNGLTLSLLHRSPTWKDAYDSDQSLAVHSQTTTASSSSLCYSASVTFNSLGLPVYWSGHCFAAPHPCVSSTPPGLNSKIDDCYSLACLTSALNLILHTHARPVHSMWLKKVHNHADGPYFKFMTLMLFPQSPLPLASSSLT